MDCFLFMDRLSQQEADVAKRDLDLLLYPLLDHFEPLCADCQEGTDVLTFEACGKASASDFATFRCPRCGRSERYLVERNS